MFVGDQFCCFKHRGRQPNQRTPTCSLLWRVIRSTLISLQIDVEGAAPSQLGRCLLGRSLRWHAPLVHSSTRQRMQIRNALRSRSNDPLRHLRFSGGRSV
jgi:hypothetical protein